MKEIINTNTEIEKNYTLMSSVIGIGLINSVFFIVYTCNFMDLEMLGNMHVMEV